MAGSAGTLETLAVQVGTALQPLQALLSPDRVIELFSDLGLTFPSQLLSQGAFTSAMSSAATAASSLSGLVSTLQNDITSGNTVAIASDGVQLLDQIGAVVTAIGNVATQLGAAAASLPGMNAGEVSTFAGNLATNLLGYLVITYLEGMASGPVGVLNLLGAIDDMPSPGVSGDPTHPPFTLRKLQLSRLGQLLSSPSTLLETLYDWGTPSFDGTKLIPRLSSSLNLLGVPTQVVDSGPPNILGSAFVNATVSPGTSPPGLAVTLNEDLPSAINMTLPITSAWSVQVQLQGTFDAALQATLTPPAGVAFKPPSGTLTGLLQSNLVAQASSADSPLILVGQTGGSYAGAGSITLGAGATVTWNASSATASVEPLIQFAISQGTVFIDMSDADGFLSDLIGGTPIQATFDLSATWEPDAGLHVQGGAQLEIDLPLHLDLGPVSIQTLYLVAGVGSSGLNLEVSVALGATLGPIQASVDRLGMTADLSFPSGGGNLGVASLALAFKSPNGMGLDIDFGLASGGGYITFDKAKGQYAGVLQMSLVDVVQVVVIGVVDTIMPDGSSGFSFLLIITFDFPPIQLGFGFTLNSVGGLGGINRSMSVDALQAGFRAHTLDAILSPPDPIANAPQIISDITNFFPVAPGRYVFGPLLTLGWGIPTLVSLTLGVLLEVPDPITIVILGLIDAGLPTEDEALLELHIEVLGVVDFGAQTLSIDGSLYDSSLLIYSIAGDLAFRMSWGNNPNLVFSLGGFNPHFNTDGLNVPANMQRMSVSIGDGDNPRISADSYFAITSNSVQFGADVQAYASAGGFSIQGYLGFDLLVILSPFSFEFDFTASFDAAYDGATLLGLSVSGTISGPTPWHLHGNASIQLLFFSVGVSVDFSWGSSTQATIPQKPVLPDLFAALSNPASWSAALPTGTGPTVTLSTPSPGSQTLLVHPMGSLAAKETVVPLDLPVTMYGNAAPSDGTEFSIASVAIGAVTETIQTIQDYFAPGQFNALSDSDKLSKPSFELYDAGVHIGSTAVLSGQDVSRTVTYDEYYIDTPTSFSRFSRNYGLPANVFGALGNQGAGFASPAKHTGLGKYDAGVSGAGVVVTDPVYVVASTTDLSIRSDIVSNDGSTYFGAQAALGTYLAAHPDETSGLQIVPLHEIAA